MFEELVGEEQLSNVTLVATQWDAVDAETGIERMRQLRQMDHMWGAMVDRGSTIEPFNGTRKGAHNILRRVLSRKCRAVLNIQREMVDQELKLSETAAGKLIREEIEKLQALHTRQLNELRVEMKEALDSKDAHLSQMLTEERTELSRQLTKYQSQIAELETHNSKLEELRNAHQEQIRRLQDSVEGRLQFLEEQNVPAPPSYDEVQSHPEALGQTSRHNALVALSSPVRSLLTVSIEMIRKLLRPKVPLGYRRLEWTCVSRVLPPLATCIRLRGRLAEKLSTAISKKRRRDH